MSRRWAIRSCWTTNYDALPAGEVARLFGDKFATTLGGLPTRPMARAGRVRLRCAPGVRERTPGRAAARACGRARRRAS